MPGKRKIRSSKSDINNDNKINDDSLNDDGDIEEGELSPEEILQSILSRLSEKRYQIREYALAELIILLRNHEFDVDLLDDINLTLQSDIISCIKKGKTNKEIELGCLSLSLLGLWLGPSSEGQDLYSNCEKQLLSLYENTSKNIQSRIASIKCLSMLLLITSQDVDVLHNIINICFNISLNLCKHKDKNDNKKNDNNDNNTINLLSCTIDSISIILSSLDLASLSLEQLSIYINKCIIFLKHNNIDVRISGGKIIAMMYSTYINLSEDDDNNNDNIDNDDILSLLEDLSIDGNKQQGKKNRAKQKCLFRNIYKNITDNIEPEETIKLSGVKHTFTGYNEIIQYNMIKDILENGINGHLIFNNVLRLLFNIDIETDNNNKIVKSSSHMGKNKQEFVANRRIREKSRYRDRKQKEATLYNDTDY